MSARDSIIAIQELLGVTADGQFGPKSNAALQALLAADPTSDWPPLTSEQQDGELHTVMASSFADPADVAAFKRCKAQGKSDQECFKVGDNGVGKWGDDCSEGSGPSCALPPEIWQKFGANAHNKKVLVKCIETGKEATLFLRDTMPHLANITNGAGIDINPDGWKLLGKTPPVMTKVIWGWAV